MSASFARRQAFSVDGSLPVRVGLAPSLVYTHTVEAATFVEVEKVLRQHVPQTEEFLDLFQLVDGICDEILGAEEVKLFQREVVQPSREVNVVHGTSHGLVRVVHLAGLRVDN